MMNDKYEYDPQGGFSSNDVDQSQWFKSYMEMLSRGEIPEYSPREAMERELEKKREAEERIPVTPRGTSAAPKQYAQKKGEIKQFVPLGDVARHSAEYAQRGTERHTQAYSQNRAAPRTSADNRNRNSGSASGNANRQQGANARNAGNNRSQSSNRSPSSNRTQAPNRSASANRGAPQASNKGGNGANAKRADQRPTARPARPVREPVKKPKKQRKLSKKELAEKKRLNALSPDERRRAYAEKIKKHKKKAKIVYVLVSTVMASSLFIALALTVLFPIKTIEIAGETQYLNSDIISAGEINVGDNLWRVDKQQINQFISSQLAYIESVSVKRKPPDTLVLTVTETNAKYAMPYGDNYILVNEAGKVLSRISREVPEGAVLLKGLSFREAIVGQNIVPAEDGKEAMETANELLEALTDNNILGITEINIANLSSVYAIYEGRLQLYFGRIAELKTKCLACEELIGKLNGENNEYTGVIRLDIVGMEFFRSCDVYAEAVTARQVASDISVNN